MREVTQRYVSFQTNYRYKNIDYFIGIILELFYKQIYLSILNNDGIQILFNIYTLRQQNLRKKYNIYT